MGRTAKPSLGTTCLASRSASSVSIRSAASGTARQRRAAKPNSEALKLELANTARCPRRDGISELNPPSASNASLRIPRLAVGAAGRKPKNRPCRRLPACRRRASGSPPTTSRSGERRCHRLNPVLVDDVVGVAEQEEVRLGRAQRRGFERSTTTAPPVPRSHACGRHRVSTRRRAGGFRPTSRCRPRSPRSRSPSALGSRVL